MNIEKRIWIVARLAEIGRQLDEIDNSQMSPREKQKLAESLRAERTQLRRELYPEVGDVEFCLQQA